jgi:hypothetical protein
LIYEEDEAEPGNDPHGRRNLDAKGQKKTHPSQKG